MPPDEKKRAPAGTEARNFVKNRSPQTVGHEMSDVKSRNQRMAWFKFFPSDFLSDPALRLCGIAAQGLWVHCLCHMHLSERRGYLLINGKSIQPTQLARIVGESPSVIEALLAELEGAGVFSRDESGVIFCRRMVRDHAYMERQRELGRKGGNPALKPHNSSEKAPVNCTLNPTLKPEAEAEAEAEIESIPCLSTATPDDSSTVEMPPPRCGDRMEGIGDADDDDRSRVDLRAEVERLAREVQP